MVYIIHAAADGPIAVTLKLELERLMPGTPAFVASKPGDIPTGADWLDEIQTNLRAADTFLLLLTPRSVGRPWIWYECGVAWARGQRLLPLVAGGLDAASIPYPLGAAQALQLENPGHAAQLFQDLGLALEDPAAFVQQVGHAANAALRSAHQEEGWNGVHHDGSYFAWKGPLGGLQDRDGIPPSRDLLNTLVRAGMTPTWGSVGRLEHHFAKGRMQVFQTDRRTWRRPVTRGGDVLLVHLEDAVGTALRALRAELDLNIAVAERAGSDQLGTEFALEAIQRVIDGGIAVQLGEDVQGALLRARGAMHRANMSIEARLIHPKGSTDGRMQSTMRRRQSLRADRI